MKLRINDTLYDTSEMLDLAIGPIEGWMGGSLRLVGIYADRDGRLYLHVYNPEYIEHRIVGDVLTRCNRDVVRYLIQRFEIPRAYLDAAPPAEAGQDDPADSAGEE